MANNATVLEKVNTRMKPKRSEGETIIKRHTFMAVAAALVPNDAFNVVASAGIQTNMIRQIAQVYGFQPDTQLVKIIITSFVSSVAGKLTSYGIRKSFNAFNNFGGFADGVTHAAISGFLTAAVGEIYLAHFKAGGTLDTIQMDEFIDFFTEKIESGDLSLTTFTNPKTAFGYLF